MLPYQFLFSFFFISPLRVSSFADFDRRNYSLEKKSSDKERGSTSGPGSYAGSGTAIPKKGKDSKSPSRKTSLNIFERLRQGKQDKIAADVQRKIRAVRAAEDLDRRVNAKRSEYQTFFVVVLTFYPVCRNKKKIFKHLSSCLTIFFIVRREELLKYGRDTPTKALRI
jgi:hypothetical protein